MAEIKERLREMAAEQLGVSPADIEDGTPLFVDHADLPPLADRSADAGLPGDSLDRVEFALAIEEAFDVSIPDAQAAQALATIDAAAVWLDARAGDASAELPA